MSMRTTVAVSREQAEYRYVQLRLAEKRKKYERQAKQFSNSILEKRLDDLDEFERLVIEDIMVLE